MIQKSPLKSLRVPYQNQKMNEGVVSTQELNKELGMVV